MLGASTRVATERCLQPTYHIVFPGLWQQICKTQAQHIWVTDHKVETLVNLAN